MHPLITYLITQDRPRDMLARAERQRLVRSAVAARFSHGPARSSTEVREMTVTHEPGVAVPDAGTPVPGGRPGIRRILVPIRSAERSARWRSLRAFAAWPTSCCAWSTCGSTTRPCGDLAGLPAE